MLHRIGTLQELDATELVLPEVVLTELTHDVAILDLDFGEDRDWSQEGGYAAVLETADDLEVFQQFVNFETHPCEWATRLSRDSGYLSALYVLNNDFAVLAFMPISIAPDVILKELEDTKQ